jgi:hypothetical protein
MPSQVSTRSVVPSYVRALLGLSRGRRTGVAREFSAFGMIVAV